LRTLGLDQPPVAKLAEELHGRGWPIPQGITESEALSRFIAEAVRG
jgi:hypothetical protein